MTRAGKRTSEDYARQEADYASLLRAITTHDGAVPCLAGHPGADWTADNVDDEHAATAAALACRSCPVMDQCGAYALEHREVSGTWGSLTPRDRRRRKRKRTAEESEGNTMAETDQPEPEPVTITVRHGNGNLIGHLDSRQALEFARELTIAAHSISDDQEHSGTVEAPETGSTRPAGSHAHRRGTTAGDDDRAPPTSTQTAATPIGSQGLERKRRESARR